MNTTNNMNFTPPNLPPHDDELTGALQELADAMKPGPTPPLPAPPSLKPVPAKDLTKAEIKERSRQIKAAHAAKKQAELDAKLAPKKAKQAAKLEKEKAKQAAKLEKEKAKAQEALETLKPGETIIEDYCPSCGKAPIKLCKGGYKMTLLGTFIHLVLLCLTFGYWIFAWIGFALYYQISKPNRRRTCMKCGKVLEKNSE